MQIRTFTTGLAALSFTVPCALAGASHAEPTPAPSPVAAEAASAAAGLLAEEDQTTAKGGGRALVPLPSVLDFTGGSGWGLALGVGLEYEAAYDGSDEYELEFDPAGAIQWRTGEHMVFFEGIEFGWRGLFAERWLLQAGGRYESGLDPSDSEDGFLDGIEKRDSHLVGFFETRFALDKEWRNWIGGRVLAGESDFGALGVFAAGHRFGDGLDGMGTEVFAFATIGDKAFLNKDFGVTAADAAASGFAETTLDSGYRSVGLQAVHRRRLTQNLELIAQAGVELYNSDIGDSPIAREDYEAEVGVSLVWRF